MFPRFGRSTVVYAQVGVIESVFFFFFFFFFFWVLLHVCCAGMERMRRQSRHTPPGSSSFKKSRRLGAMYTLCYDFMIRSNGNRPGPPSLRADSPFNLNSRPWSSDQTVAHLGTHAERTRKTMAGGARRAGWGGLQGQAGGLVGRMVMVMVVAGLALTCHGGSLDGSPTEGKHSSGTVGCVSVCLCLCLCDV